ncbi:hypothetical protein NSA31_22405 [Bacillus subtilis]|uniref:hypothetical protein n=1 Tax=Bacillus subtilis TaxID=1423 RepID=UPI002149F181|nr:hypothetical protein [Bacillus subtilis]MCR1994494.1 hypothetical protein [Bacillus subtilis]
METKKYVRIKKATVEGVWYADRIGQIFEVERLNSVSVLTNRGVHGESSVLVEDVEFIFTEKRKPAVGERVLVTNAITVSGAYKAGDICTVWSVYPYGVVTVREHRYYLVAEEYEVVVNNEVKNEEADEMKREYAFKPNLDEMGYEELLAHGDAVMEAIKKRTFQEGFRAAKQVQRKLAKMNAEKSAQARRDEIVEQAKGDIEVLKSPGRMVNGNTSDYKVDLFGANAEFIVNREKRTVVALLKGAYSGTVVLARGIAKAAPDDCFNVHIGKAIALRRALSLAVPDEYLNAPQPTEVRVGDVVQYSKRCATVVAGRPNGFGETKLTTANGLATRIIDDSREEVGE